MGGHVLYSFENDVFKKPIAVRLGDDGYSVSIYGPPGDIHGVRLLEHDQIITALHEMGYETFEYLPYANFRAEAAKRHATRLGITVEEWLAF